MPNTQKNVKGYFNFDWLATFCQIRNKPTIFLRNFAKSCHTVFPRLICLSFQMLISKLFASERQLPDVLKAVRRGLLDGLILGTYVKLKYKLALVLFLWTLPIDEVIFSDVDLVIVDLEGRTSLWRFWVSFHCSHPWFDPSEDGKIWL